ncbi:FixH family protein [uncultured Psychrosphaera sp.]|uniref:FixH family protein n=1 Tax=uncultured Psychrosphaera sp. TaxID=1403522 RepID=UPI00262F2370|nr:FixH family protein [uncultured Psychrosphaera sp.]
MKSESWYRNPWVWLIIALPMSAVIGGIATIIITNKHQPDMVVDDYYKKGKAINQELTLYDNALKLGITLEVKVNEHRIEVKSPMEFTALKVKMIHSTLAEQDFDLVLTPNAVSTLSSSIETIMPGKWKIIVMPMDNSWKVRKTVALPNTTWMAF